VPGEPRDYDDYDGYLAPDWQSVDVARERADDLLAQLREHARATFLRDEDVWAAGQ